MAGAAPVAATIDARGLVVPLAEFRARLGGSHKLAAVLRALTVVEKVFIPKPYGAPEIRRAYDVRDDKRTLVLPRRLRSRLEGARCADGAPLLGAVTVRLAATRALAADCGQGGPALYPYQAATVELLCGPAGPLGPASIARGEGSAYLSLDTGLGKSRIAGAVIARRREPALVVVPTCAIADQWVAELAAAFPRLRAAVYRNVLRRPPTAASHDAVVVVVNTFREKEPAFLAGFGTVVLDEAHEYHSPCNCRALWLAQARAVLGLSATPLGRPDGLDRFVVHHLGEPLRPTGVELPSFRGEVRKIVYTSHPDREVEVRTSAGAVSAIATIAALATDPERQRLIAVEVARLLGRHTAAEAAGEGLGPRPAAAACPGRPAGEVRRHGVFVFAELREHLIALRSALAEAVGEAELFAPELDAAADGPPSVSVLRGGVRRQEVERAQRARVVLTTFGFSRRGISLREMTAIVLASPRRNGLKQITGRILRQGSDESICRVVVDVVDARSPLKKQFGERRRVYDERRFLVTQIRANWEAFAQPALPGGAPGPAPDLVVQGAGAAGPAPDPAVQAAAIRAASVTVPLAGAAEPPAAPGGGAGP
ncbi:MAG TPA: DEAD/DEAH box helicase family protein [Elusimicrobiota bacterium]|nr:DEAD/DEAH box helicase family protein [Elusimicrobiota bacterium]